MLTDTDWAFVLVISTICCKKSIRFEKNIGRVCCTVQYAQMLEHMLSTKLDITFKTHHFPRLHRVNKHVAMWSTVLTIFSIMLYFPTPSRYVSGHFWEESLSFKDNWIYFVIFLGLTLLSHFVQVLNRTLKSGTIHLDEEHIRIQKDNQQFEYEIDYVHIIELNNSNYLYIKTLYDFHHLDIVGYPNLKTLNTLLYKYQPDVGVKIRD